MIIFPLGATRTQVPPLQLRAIRYGRSSGLVKFDGSIVYVSFFVK